MEYDYYILEQYILQKEGYPELKIRKLHFLIDYDTSRYNDLYINKCNFKIEYLKRRNNGLVSS